MQAAVFRMLLALLVLSTLGLLWVNSGSHVEAGYAYCDGGGFIPASELSPYNPGGPCLGSPTTQTMAGRYASTSFLTLVLGTVGGVSAFSLVLLDLRRRAPRLFQNCYFRYVGLPVILAVAGFVANFYVFDVIALDLSLAWQPGGGSLVRAVQTALVQLIDHAALAPAVILLIRGIVAGSRQRKPVLVALILLLLTGVVLMACVYFSQLVALLVS